MFWEGEDMGVYEKLVSVQCKLYAPKSKYNKFGNYYYRSCEDILEGCKPLLKEVNASLYLSDEIIQVGDRFYVKATATFTDNESGEKITNVAYARESTEVKGMSAPQTTGASSTFARKYALNGLFCIDDTVDDDTEELKNEKDNRVKQEKKVSKPQNIQTQNNQTQTTKNVQTQNTQTQNMPTKEVSDEPSKEVKEMLKQETIDSVDKNLIPQANTLISKEQLAMIYSEMKRTGVSEKQILALAKVDSLEKMEQTTAVAILNKLGRTSSRQ